jgi:hypothetical protein
VPLRPLYVLAFCLVLSGCLPSSCKREEDRTLLASDSLSLSLAEGLAVDTLTFVWQSDALEYPRTLRWGPDGLYAVDAENAAVYVFDDEGAVVRAVETDLEAPFLAGFRGDSVVLFQPTPAAFGLYPPSGSPRTFDVAALPPDRAMLRYASVWGDGFVFKGLSETTPPFIQTLDAAGDSTGRLLLPGPFWRFAGLVKPDTGSALLSLSGFRPVVDVVPAEELRQPAGDTLDLRSLDLQGFVAPIPILARSRRFALGAELDPPLLSASAAAAGDYLFVLNMRPGWLRVDAYNRDGVLQHAMTQPNPQAGRSFYPVDLDARQVPGGYELAVALKSPETLVTVFRWTPPR